MHMTTCLHLIKKSLNSQGNMEITLHNIKLQYISRKTHYLILIIKYIITNAKLLYCSGIDVILQRSYSAKNMVLCLNQYYISGRDNSDFLSQVGIFHTLEASS